MSLSRVVITAMVLFLLVRVPGGVRLAPGLDPLAMVGTLLVVALILGVIDALAAPVRLALRRLSATFAVWVAGAVLLNAVLFWAAGWCARVIGLGFAVTGFGAALVGSLLLAVLSPLAASLGRGRAQ